MPGWEAWKEMFDARVWAFSLLRRSVHGLRTWRLQAALETWEADRQVIATDCL
jgi:hypothetical protein